MKKIIIFCAAFVALILQNQFAQAEPAQFRGKSLDQWFKSYFVWYLNGSSPIKYAVDGVRYLPLPQQLPVPVDPNNPYPGVDNILTGTLDVAVKKNQYLLLPISTWTGEKYQDGSQDSPQLLIDNDVFVGTSIKITVDGKIFYSGTAQQLNSYHFGPTYFDQPIAYQQPTNYGAIAAVWEEGTGLIYPPLPKGRHSIDVLTITPVFGLGFHNTWNIVVKDD